ncbi:MAG: PilZ domain-containing protein [Vicinamibacterales bacterium]
MSEYIEHEFVERRQAVRVTAASVEDAIAARIRPGHQVTLVDISSAGVLVESSRRLSPGAIVELHLDGVDRRHVSRARVVRAWVSGVLPAALTYRAALDLESHMAWLSDR